MMKTNLPVGVCADVLRRLHSDERNDAITAIALACRGYCEYYTGDEAKEGCAGLAAVWKGIETGKIGLFHVSCLLNLPPGPVRRTGCLINEMCHHCGYLDGVCDYMSSAPSADATPCGGYRLIQALVDHGALTPGQVRTIVQNAGRSTQEAE